MKHLEIKNLRFTYDQQTDVVKNVSFLVKKGSYTSIIGHNGSGKSTIAKLIIGLLEKSDGEIIIDGIPLNEDTVNQIRGKVGIVFQNPDNQFIGSTVRDDIAFGLENHQVPQKDMDDIITHFAKEVGMSEYLENEPTRLSGGQKQRVAIAGVLAMKPDILILDEATSMLDPKGKEEVNSLVDEIHREHNMTIISITHDIEEVVKSDYVFVMNEGEFVMQGEPKDVLLHAKTLIDIDLDVPFTVKMALALKKHGVIIDEPMNMKRMVEQLCQLRLSK
ncbi:MAG: energy-coupling factor transporter ATPase [Firmicutes bacterium HGW-Firmicutes-10]|nr:MAG: energy-coupling factor transporter ATPase [Firmicutes bacterium HGW-Firmicutes-10]